MRSFLDGVIERQPLSQGLLQTIRQLGEYKGRQQLYTEQAPQVLKALQHAAQIESTESSNRIEGVAAPHDRIAEIVARRAQAPEPARAGDRRLPRRAAKHPRQGGRHAVHHRPCPPDARGPLPLLHGPWRRVETCRQRNHRNPAGRIEAPPLQATSSPRDARRRWRTCTPASSRPAPAGAIEPLLLIPAYVLDFLCIHPFLDGNGRTARLLTLLLLYQAGYEVGRFISLEQMVERTKRSYYDTLLASSQGWHEGRHSLVPWWEYFLGVMMLGCYREFEKRVGAITVRHGAKREMIVDTVRRLPAEFRVGGSQARLPRRQPGHHQPHPRPDAPRRRHPLPACRPRCRLGQGANRQREKLMQPVSKLHSCGRSKKPRINGKINRRPNPDPRKIRMQRIDQIILLDWNDGARDGKNRGTQLRRPSTAKPLG